MPLCSPGLRQALRRWTLGALVGALGLTGLAAHAADDPPGRVGRLAEVYGRWEHRSGARDSMSLPWQMTRLAMTGGEAVLPKAPARDYIYAADLASALLALTDAAAPPHPLYHLGVESPFDSPAWCERLARHFASGFAKRYGRPRDELGFVPRYRIDAAFADYIGWLERHRTWLVDPGANEG